MHKEKSWCIFCSVKKKNNDADSKELRIYIEFRFFFGVYCTVYIAFSMHLSILLYNSIIIIIIIKDFPIFTHSF